MKISHNWLQTYFAKPIPSPEKLDALFTFHAFEVEGIDEVKDERGKVTDTVLDLKVLPDRAHYALCHEGIAREVAVMTGEQIKDRDLPKVNQAIDIKPTVTIEAKGFCRRYIGRYVDIGDSGAGRVELGRDGKKSYACKLLEAIGERGISTIVDATNICMFDIGQPLHAFDADKVKGNIVVRAAKKGEKISLLDSSAGAGKEIELTEADHVIADDEGPLAIAGVKGGKRAAITGETKRLILESANFEPTAVRKTSTKYDLRSESSKRYENEITPELALEGITNLSALIQQSVPEAKFGPIVDVYPTKAVQTVIEMDPKYINERLGIEVPLETSKNILESMGIQISNIQSSIASESQWQLTIPFNRLDLTIPDDIVEEVGRIYGYEHVVGVLPPKPSGDIKVLPIYYLAEKIKNILVNQGYSEVSLYSLVVKGDIEAAKPLARDKAFARKNLVDGMTVCVEKNVLNADLIGLDSIKIFEIGHAFNNDGETVHLSIGAAQVKKVKGMNGKKLIEEAVGILNKELAVNVEQLNKGTIQLLEKGPVAVIEIDLNELLKSYKLPARASYSDLGFGPASKNSYKKISQYPFIVRDVAVFVPENIESTEVWSTIEDGMKTAKKLLVRHALFDTFKKDGKVSYAFRMIFQSMDKTLTDDEANIIMTAIYSMLKKKGWEVR